MMKRFATALFLAAAAGVFAQEPEPPATGARIEFMDLPNMDITEILKVLSDSSDLNIIPSKDVAGKLSVFLKDISTEEALEKIASVNGYRFVREGNTITVMTEEQYELKVGPLTEQRVLRLQYARAAEVAPLLAGALSAKGQVVPDVVNNQLIVFEVPSRWPSIEKLVASLDQKEETRVIPLQHARAADLAISLSPFLRDPRSLEIDERTNRLILTDTPYHLGRLEEIVKQLDLEDLTETRAFALRYADADRVADLLIEILTGERAEGSRRGSGLPSRSSALGQQAEPIAATVVAATESPRTRRDESRSSLASSAVRNGGDLSQPFRSQAPSGTAAAIAAPPAPVASAAPEPVFDAAAPMESGEARALGRQGTISADPRTNSVIVTHTPATLARIETIVQSLDVELPLHVYRFEHADLELLGIEDKLAQLLPGPAEDFQIDAATRKVTFRAPPSRSEHILALFREWDEAVPQVYIEARILRVSLDLMRDLGVSLRVNDRGPGGELDSAVDLLFPPRIGVVPSGIVQFGDLTADEYTVIVQALESDSRSKLLSNPRVAVLDRGEAIFQVVVDQPFVEVVTDANSDITRESTRFIPVGVTLSVAPLISNEGLVQMDVRVEVSSLLSFSPDGIPVVDRSEAKSSVAVRDGYTLGIGGLIVDEKTQNINRVPWLGKIPVLKHLFRNKSDGANQSELLLFITPHLTANGTLDPPPDEIDLEASRLHIGPEASFN